MTEREACERIVEQGNCEGVYCSDCPLYGAHDCTNVALARAWLDAHRVEKTLLHEMEDMLKKQQEEHEKIRNTSYPMYDLVKENIHNILRAIDPIREDNTRRYIDCQVTMIVRKLKGLDCTGMEEDCAEYARRIALEDYDCEE